MLVAQSRVVYDSLRCDINVNVLDINVNVLDKNVILNEKSIGQYMNVQVALEEQAFIKTMSYAFLTEEEVKHWLKNSIDQIFYKKVHDEQIFDFEQLCLDEKYLKLSVFIQVLELSSFSLSDVVQALNKGIRNIAFSDSVTFQNKKDIYLPETVKMNFMPFILAYDVESATLVKDHSNSNDIIQVVSYYKQSNNSVICYEILKTPGKLNSNCGREVIFQIVNRIVEDTKQCFNYLKYETKLR